MHTETTQEEHIAEAQPNATGISGWLRKLADESWQAELIISGIAIVGSLSLPSIINDFGNWCLITFAEDKFFLLAMILIYLYLMAGGLIAAFLVHFFIRVLWIGMLGLSSVYPDGIKPIKSFSDHFNEKMGEEFPDIASYSHKLDQQGSLIFSIASAMCMVAISSIFVMAIVTVLASFIHWLLPAVHFALAAGLLFLFILLPGVMASLMHQKKLRAKEWVKKYHFKIFMLSGQAVYTIFFKPFSYITYTLISSGKKQSNLGNVILMALFLGIFAAVATNESNVKYFMAPDAFRRFANPVYGLHETFYEDQRKSDEIILYASLESEMLSGKYIKVFVPILGRESEARDAHCGEFIKTEGKDNRIPKQEFENECLKKYLTVYLNEVELDDFTLYKHTHPETGQFGAKLYVSCADCKLGENEIRISRPFPVGAEKPYLVYLPFVYEGE